MRPVLDYTKVIATSFVPERQDRLKFEEIPGTQWTSGLGTPVGHAVKRDRYSPLLTSETTSASILSNSGLVMNLPPTTTALIFRVLPISASGLASSKTRSAILPFAIVPTESSRPRYRAGSRVAACNASIGVKPA